MTIEEAIQMIKAKKKCIESDTSGKGELCSRECDDCDLNYMQGNMGEQKEWLGMSIEALKFQQEYQAEVQKCIERLENRKKHYEHEMDLKDDETWVIEKWSQVKAYMDVIRIIKQELEVINV